MTYTIIFLHGALLGGWIWQGVIEDFKKGGHEVIAPNLAGRDGKDLDRITLHTHVSLIQDLVEHAKNPVVVVAHSMSGVVAAQLSEEISSKIKKVIYVSAYLPQNGQSLEDVYEKYFGSLTYDTQSMSIKLGKQLSVDDLIAASFDDCFPQDQSLVRNNAVSEPIKPSLDKLKLSKEKFGTVKKAYIRPGKDKVIPPELQDQMIGSHGIEEVHEINTGHAPFCAKKDEFVRLIKKSMENL
ncbi:MAG: alpha/beta hydrolase [Bdellovibrionales bacterium]|nr:alpha/beta hydrolase [Bdellovibrionales bacterium]